MDPSEELDPPPQRSFPRGALVIVVVVVAGVAAAWMMQSSETGPAGGRPVADFDLPLLGSERTLSNEDLAQGPVVVNFWASWCVPCKKEMPMFEEAWREHRDEGLQVIGINVQDSEEFALEFVRDRDITYPIVRDADQGFARSLGVRGRPQTFFMSPGWVLLDDSTTNGVRTGPVVVGEIDRQTLEAHIARLLADH